MEADSMRFFNRLLGLRDRRRGLFCEVASEHEFELGGIEFPAGCAEDPPAECVDGLFQDNDLGSLAGDVLVALGNFF